MMRRVPLLLMLATVSHGAELTQVLDLTTPYGQNPLSATNAAISYESFANVYYWRPADVNEWSEIIYRVDFPFEIETAELLADVRSYTLGHHEANFDPGAESHLDISTSGSDWSTLVSTFPGASTNEYRELLDVSEFVSGAESVYLRSRQFINRGPGI